MTYETRAQSWEFGPDERWHATECPMHEDAEPTDDPECICDELVEDARDMAAERLFDDRI